MSQKQRSPGSDSLQEAMREHFENCHYLSLKVSNLHSTDIATKILSIYEETPNDMSCHSDCKPQSLWPVLYLSNKGKKNAKKSIASIYVLDS